MRAHTFDALICSNILLRKYLQQLVLKICRNYVKFAATLFYFQQICFICSKVFKFAATLFHLQQPFNLQHFPCRPPYFVRAKQYGHRNVTFFQWLSKAITRLPLPNLAIGLRISRQLFNQWEPKPIAPCARNFSRVLNKLRVISRNSGWFIALFALIVICRSNYLGRDLKIPGRERVR